MSVPSVAIRQRLSLYRAASALALVLAASAAAHAESLDATEVMRRNYAAGKVTDSRTELTLTLISADAAERKRATEVQHTTGTGARDGRKWEISAGGGRGGSIRG